MRLASFVALTFATALLFAAPAALLVPRNVEPSGELSPAVLCDDIPSADDNSTVGIVVPAPVGGCA